MERIWTCTIGGNLALPLPNQADGPMRRAVEAAFEELTGETAQFAFSGWDAHLPEEQRAVVENRLPDPTLTVPKVEPIVRGQGTQRQRLYMHECGNVEWIGDDERDEIGGGCDACESGSTNPLDWTQLYQPVVR